MGIGIGVHCQVHHAASSQAHLIAIVKYEQAVLIRFAKVRKTGLETRLLW
jgi:hypothetical protein